MMPVAFVMLFSTAATYLSCVSSSGSAADLVLPRLVSAASSSLVRVTSASKMRSRRSRISSEFTMVGTQGAVGKLTPISTASSTSEKCSSLVALPHATRA